REELAGVPDDVRIAGVLEGGRLRQLELEEPGIERAASRPLFDQPAALDVAVPVRGAALTQGDRMDHPVAIEPVVAAVRFIRRVRTVAVIGAVQVARDLPQHLEIVGLALQAPGGEVALQEGVQLGFAGRHAEPSEPRSDAGRERRWNGAGRVSCVIMASRTSLAAGAPGCQNPAMTREVTPCTAHQKAAVASSMGTRSRPTAAIAATRRRRPS